MEIQIYFTTEFNLKAEGAIQQIMLNTLQKYQRLNNLDYISEANTDIEGNDAAQQELTKLIRDNDIAINSFEYNSLIKALPIEFGFENNVKHSFDIFLKLKSIKYNCVKIIDGARFLCYTNDDEELRVIAKPNNYKVFIVKN